MCFTVSETEAGVALTFSFRKRWSQSQRASSPGGNVVQTSRLETRANVAGT